MLARVALTAFALLAIAPAAVAGTVPVTTQTDSDDGACTPALCSLRDGIKYSKKGDRVEVPAGTYDLTLGELQITHDMTLAGAGSSTTTIDAGGGSRVIETTGITGAISGLTLTRGENFDSDGGALLLSGTVTVTDLAVTDSEVVNGRGGGIFSEGTNSFTGLTLSRNKAKNDGGGGAGSGSGGGIFVAGTDALTDVTATGNSATSTASNQGFSGSGGGVFVNGTATLNRVTLSQNSATATNNPAATDGAGGGDATDGTAYWANVTVTHNTASGSGGGLFDAGTDDLSYATFSADGAALGGDAIATGTIDAKNSVFGAATSGGDCAETGTFASDGHNISSDGTCTRFTKAGDLRGTDPMLGSLGTNGGPTPTQPLLAGSPAIEHADATSCETNGPNSGKLSKTCPATDQRDVARTADSGAYEFSPPTSSAAVTSCPGNATFTVSPTAGGAAPTAVHVVIDGGGEQRLATSGSPGTASLALADGAHSVVYWGESVGGDQEVAHHTATVDGCAAPASAASSPFAPGPLPVVAVASTTTAPAVKFSDVFTLPSTRRCVSRRHFRIRVHKIPGVTLVSARVLVNGKPVKVLKGSRLTSSVDLRGLPKGRFSVTITAVTSAGKTISDTRRYRTCARKVVKKPHKKRH